MLHTVSIPANLGIQWTPRRKALYSLLEKSTTPLSVEEIGRELSKQKIRLDRATLFRIINLFTQMRITKKVEFNEGKFRYELSNRPHHHHLICKKCDSIEDVEVKQDLSVEEKRIARELKFLVSDHALEFYGLCKHCQ